MRRKLMLGCAALLAFAAFAVAPGTALAVEFISSGSLVPNGTEIRGETINSVQFKSLSGGVLFECQTGELTGTVYRNSSALTAQIAVSNLRFKGGATEERCEASSWGPALVKFNTPDCFLTTGEKWFFSGGACGTGGTDPRLTWEAPNLGLCPYLAQENAVLFHGNKGTEPLAVTTNEKQKLNLEEGEHSNLCIGGYILEFSMRLKTAAGADLKVQ